MGNLVSLLVHQDPALQSSKGHFAWSLGYFGFGVCPWNPFLPPQSKSSSYRKYRKHTMDTHGRNQQRRLKQGRVLRFLCLGLNIRSAFTACLALHSVLTPDPRYPAPLCLGTLPAAPERDTPQKLQQARGAKFLAAR